MSGYMGNGPGRGQRQVFSFTASASQTTFSGVDTAGLTLTYKPRFIDVYVNGLCILPTEYTATNGSSIVFDTGLNASDVVYVVSLSAFDVANALAKDQDGADISNKVAFRNNLGVGLAGFIVGIKVENDVTDANNDMAFDDGACASDEINPILMVHTAGVSQIDVTYGTGNGGNFDAADAVGTWHCFVISNGVTVSRGFSQSLDPTGAPNYPAGFTHWRRVASRVRVGTSFASVKQVGKRNYLLFPNAAYNTTPATTKTAVALRVPSGIPVVAIFNASLTTASGSSLTAIFPDPDQSDQAPSVSAAPGVDLVAASLTGVVNRAGGIFERLTDGSGNIYYRASAASGNLLINTLGWIDDLLPT